MRSWNKANQRNVSSMQIRIDCNNRMYASRSNVSGDEHKSDGIKTGQFQNKTQISDKNAKKNV